MSSTFGRYRERVTQFRSKAFTSSLGPVGVYKTYVNGLLQSTTNRMLTGAGPSCLFEKCWDVNNAAASDKKTRRGQNRRFRVGGPFASVKIATDSLSVSGFGTYFATEGSTRREYTGGFCNPVLHHDAPDTSHYTSGGPSTLQGNPFIPDTSSFEQRAFTDTMPKIEKVSALNALYEFKDVPGQLKQTSRIFKDLYIDQVGVKTALKSQLMPNRVAEDYLNYHFGWVPFCKDIAQMVDYIIFSKQYLDDISHGNDTWIKRKAVLLDVTAKALLGSGLSFGCEPQGEDMNQLCNIMETNGQFHFGSYKVWSETTTRCWAEGAFKYYRPEFDTKMPYYGTKVAEINRHLAAAGLRLTPYHIWKAIPWSWCIDWFSNVGDVIKRQDAQYLDGMVTKYLYLMHHRKQVIKSEHFLNFKSGARTVTFTRYLDVKQRKDASSPYGFVLGGDLSATQWSILAALGLTGGVKFARSF